MRLIISGFPLLFPALLFVCDEIVRDRLIKEEC